MEENIFPLDSRKKAHLPETRIHYRKNHFEQMFIDNKHHTQSHSPSSSLSPAVQVYLTL